MGSLRRAVVVGALAVALTACGASADVTDRAGAPSGGDIAGDVLVFAAASLTDAFTEIGEIVERQHPQVTVTFNFAGSQQLATQIIEGARADVFASADQAQMATVVDAGAVAGIPVVFARNQLAIAVEAGNPASVSSLRDLQRDDVTVVLAAEQVPAGRYTREALDRAGVTLAPVSLETDVRAVLTKVALGEVDTGIVYTSDLAAAGDRVDGVAIPDEHNVTATYPIATLATAENPAGAQTFIDAVRSDSGRTVLKRAGFGAP
ncbi:MAG: molybdate ABC transporter substrate-binding protein [Actinobacteria bacterium]|nr:molybdate ABC transporter substrate-binding protein [Actinomycetota bacterium]